MVRKHNQIINISEIEPRVEARGDRFGFVGRRLGPHVGAKSIGSSYIEVQPGRQAFPNHFHTSNEEAVFVIEGKGHVRIGKDEVEVKAGDYIGFPVGPDHAHSIRNSSLEVLKLLCISTLNPVEVVGYPDSKKTAAFAMADASKGLVSGGTPWVRMLVREQPSVDYYDGEEHEREGHFMKCSCDSGLEFSQCCEPFLLGASAPETAEKLMRSRYTAFVRAEMDYIKRTLAPESRRDFDMEANRKWAKESKWHGLKILSTKEGGPADKSGVVEFIATFEQDGQALDHHEVAKFRRGDNGVWLFVEGDSHTHPQGEGHAHSHAKPETHRREQPKVGRNDACVCGSGKKYKKCCGGAA